LEIMYESLIYTIPNSIVISCIYLTLEYGYEGEIGMVVAEYLMKKTWYILWGSGEQNGIYSGGNGICDRRGKV